MIGETGNAPAGVTVGARTAAGSIFISGVGGWTNFTAGDVEVVGVGIVALVWSPLPGGKHSGTVRIGKTGGVFDVGTFSTMGDRTTEMRSATGAGRLMHKSSGASSSCGLTDVLIPSRESCSECRKVFILKSVGTSSFAGGSGTQRV